MLVVGRETEGGPYSAAMREMTRPCTVTPLGHGRHQGTSAHTRPESAR